MARARQAIRDDLEAFESLVHRYQATVLGNCRYLSGSHADAEDLAQEVFVKMFYGLARFEGRSTFKTWLWRIKVNHCLNFLQRRRKERTVDVEAPGLDRSPELQVVPLAERALETEDDRVRIERALDQMTESLRVPLLLRDLDGFSYQEIAEQLELSLSAVKMRIKRGREDFRHRYAVLSGEAEV
ncbi:MAG: RNA polymerase sigma factor [Alphaproteobacteria bacterium]|nr:RNA polymerase sigma factor [Alphaproteobacteria bacterium]